MSADWHIYRGDGVPNPLGERLPDPPQWRSFDVPGPAGATRRRLGDPATYRPSGEAIDLVNAALYLRRPLLVTGRPGTGKSTLAHNVAYELQLGPVLSWPITSRSNRQEGLYQYDALARLQDASLARGPEAPPRAHGRTEADSRNENSSDIGRYIRLGPLGTALLPTQEPRVLLIDELDKSDIDLPGDLLTLFEEGEYEIPELSRIAAEQPEARVLTHDGTEPVIIVNGRVRCRAFPLVIITSNGERVFPPPFLRRCLQLDLKQPDRGRLAAIVRAHLGGEWAEGSDDLIREFIDLRSEGALATDQLLNAIYLRFNGAWGGDKDKLIKAILRNLEANGS